MKGIVNFLAFAAVAVIAFYVGVIILDSLFSFADSFFYTLRYGILRPLLSLAIFMLAAWGVWTFARSI